MNIYKISQTVNNNWDTFDGAVVVASNEDEASRIFPIINTNGVVEYLDETTWSVSEVWTTNPEDVKVELIGTTKLTKPQVILSSFNAG